MAEDLEMLHAVLEGLSGADPQSPIPTKVFLFPNDAWMRSFNPAAASGLNSGRAVAGGFFAPRPLANFVAINLRTSRTAREVIQHEYLHYFARHNLPRLPFWFSEGLAEYYSTFYVADGTGYVGRPVESRIQMLTETSHEFAVGWRQLEELAELRSVSELHGDGHAALLAYARSWAIVHFLLSDDDRAELTMGFMRELARGTDSVRAFEESFSEPLESLSRPLNHYLAAGDFRTFRTSVPDVQSPALAEMAAPEVFASLGELASAVGNHNGARQLFGRAIAKAAQSQYGADEQAEFNGLADLGLAQLALAANDPQRAVELAISACEKVPFLADSWLVLGLARQQAAPPNPTDDEREDWLKETRSAFRNSLDRNPDLPAALILHGKTWIEDPLSSIANRSKKQPEVSADYVLPGIKSLQRELEVAPHGIQGTKLLSTLLTLDGQFDQGLAVLLRERPRFADEDEWGVALEAVGEIEGKQLYHQLQRKEAPALEPLALEAIRGRLDFFERSADRYGQLSFLFARGQEIRRLFELEALWTDLAAAQADYDAGEVTNAGRLVDYILQEIGSSLDWEGTRVERLEQAADDLRQQLGL